MERGGVVRLGGSRARGRVRHLAVHAGGALSPAGALSPELTC
jgi:hypothetical protein